MKRTQAKLIKIILITAAVAAVFLLSDLYCVVRIVTGIPCPTCGITRACIAAARLDFQSAFFYHPLFFLAPVVPAALLLEAFRLPPRVRRMTNAVLIVCAVLFFTVYVMRLANGSIRAI